MIQKLTDAWAENNEKLTFSGFDPTYKEFVKHVIETLLELKDISVTCFYYGSYQGDLLICVDLEDYENEWIGLIGYGSCCVCDSLESAFAEKDDKIALKEKRALALHVIQSLKPLSKVFKV